MHSLNEGRGNSGRRVVTSSRILLYVYRERIYGWIEWVIFLLL